MPVNRSLRIGHEAPCPRAKRSGKSAARNLWDQLTTMVEPTADHEVGPRSDMGIRATGRFMSCVGGSQMRRVWKLVARLMTGDQSTQEAPGLLAPSIRGSNLTLLAPLMASYRRGSAPVRRLESTVGRAVTSWRVWGSVERFANDSELKAAPAPGRSSRCISQSLDPLVETHKLNRGVCCVG